MYKSRKIESKVTWLDSDNIKIYTISFDDSAVNQNVFLEQLSKVKMSIDIDWKNTPAFVIFHKGNTMNYLVLSWWGNDNELFTSVSVEVCDKTWLTDSKQFSFCLYDMEVMWRERNIYIDLIDCEFPSIEKYQISR